MMQVLLPFERTPVNIRGMLKDKSESGVKSVKKKRDLPSIQLEEAESNLFWRLKVVSSSRSECLCGFKFL